MVTPFSAPIADKISRLRAGYSPREEMPLGTYAALTLIFVTLLTAAILTARFALTRWDLALAGVGTHKLSRILTKDAITSFLRAPFTRYRESLGYGELGEAPRLTGSLAAIGELLCCSYCMGAWVALGFFWAFSQYPEPARNLAGMLSILAIANFLHVLYERTRMAANVLTLREEKMERETDPDQNPAPCARIR